MTFNSTSFKQAVEQIVRLGFEEQMLEAIDTLEKELIIRLKEKTTEARNEAKKTASKMAVELLHKSGVNGFSLELKL